MTIHCKPSSREELRAMYDRNFREIKKVVRMKKRLLHCASGHIGDDYLSLNESLAWDKVKDKYVSVEKRHIDLLCVERFLNDISKEL